MGSGGRGAWRLAGLVGLLALLVYLRTLYPGLVGDGDTPKFQYVGAIGGTPHNPGYPLYLVLSGAFSRLPFGNLAWRVNLLSAVAAALFVLLQCRLARLLGAAPAVAAAVALAAGFGPVLWSQATLAEVYTLAAALLTGVLVALVAWGGSEPRREAGLLLATAVFALALGHHLTVVFAAPAGLLYALLVDRRLALRPRILLGALALGLAGLSQYLLILWRTLRGAPYLGSTARNLPELFDVMRGAQFGNRLFAYDLGTLLWQRLPLLARVIAAELGPVGLPLAVAGLVLLLRRRRPEGLLLGLGALGVLAFALNYKVDDPKVFLVPVFALLWPAVAVGLQALCEAAAARTPLGPRVALLALLLPALQLGLHFKASDHSDRTFELRYFGAVAAHAPRDGVFLAESYTVDQMLLYELLGEGHGAAKGLRLSSRIPSRPRSTPAAARRCSRSPARARPWRARASASRPSSSSTGRCPKCSSACLPASRCCWPRPRRPQAASSAGCARVACPRRAGPSWRWCPRAGAGCCARAARPSWRWRAARRCRAPPRPCHARWRRGWTSRRRAWSWRAARSPRPGTSCWWPGSRRPAAWSRRWRSPRAGLCPCPSAGAPSRSSA